MPRRGARSSQAGGQLRKYAESRSDLVILAVYPARGPGAHSSTRSGVSVQGTERVSRETPAAFSAAPSKRASGPRRRQRGAETTRPRGAPSLRGASDTEARQLRGASMGRWGAACDASANRAQRPDKSCREASAKPPPGARPPTRGCGAHRAPPSGVRRRATDESSKQVRTVSTAIAEPIAAAPWAPEARARGEQS
jgi:hypothetical protein